MSVLSLGYVGKTVWDLSAQLQSLKAEVVTEADSHTDKKLLSFLEEKRWLQWQIDFEREQAARDRAKLADLQRLQGHR